MKLFKNYGPGVGLRNKHIQHFLKQIPTSVKWMEAVTENYLSWENGFQVKAIEALEKLSTQIPIALHGVSMNIGSADTLDLNYLKRLKELKNTIKPILISDHLCWTGVNQENLHDLMPVPFTTKNLKYLTDRIKKIQDVLGERIAIENVSSYFEYTISEMTEWEFISELIQKADCGLLLDVNNVYVSSVNHNFNAQRFLLSLPKNRIAQIHLAGHSVKDGYLIDTHSTPVCKEVWDLFDWTVQNLGSYSTMIERDSQIPEWEELEKEVLKIDEIQRKYNERTQRPTGQLTTGHQTQA